MPGVTSGLVVGWSLRLRLHVKYYRRVGTTVVVFASPRRRVSNPIQKLTFHFPVFSAEILIFTLVRKRFRAIYEPRTYLITEE